MATHTTRWMTIILTTSLALAVVSSGPGSETSNAQSAATTATTAWTPELSMRVKAVGNVRVSPDGKRVLFTVNEPVMTADKSEYLTNIWMANADGSDAYPDDLRGEIIDQR